MPHILVSGIVSQRDKRPYVHIDVDGHLVQLSMAEARGVANDILTQAFRAEADAMIHKFFDKQGYPEAAGAALMKEFRDFRSELDEQRRDTFERDPEA